MRNEKGRSQAGKQNSAERTRKTVSATPPSKSPESVEVLYQKLGDRWFAFSLIGEDVYFGSVDPTEIDVTKGSDAPTPRKGRGVDRTGTA